MRIALVAAGAAIFATSATPAGAAQGRTGLGIRLLDPPRAAAARDPRARSYIVDSVAPGAHLTRHVEVLNDLGRSAAVRVYPVAATIERERFTLGSGRSSNDLTSWVRVGAPSIDLSPSQRRSVQVDIVVPADAPEGERYGAVMAEVSQPPAQLGGFTLVTRVGVRIYLSVSRVGQPVTDFTVSTLQAARAASGQATLTAVVRNTGGRAIDLSGEVRLLQGPLGARAGPFAVPSGTTVPIGGTAMVLVPLASGLANGPWLARLELRSGAQVRVSTAQVTFPAAPDSHAGPVRAATFEPKQRAGLALAQVLLLLGLLLLALLLLARTVLRRARRRHHRTAVTGG